MFLFFVDKMAFTLHTTFGCHFPRYTCVYMLLGMYRSCFSVDIEVGSDTNLLNREQINFEVVSAKDEFCNQMPSKYY